MNSSNNKKATKFRLSRKKRFYSQSPVMRTKLKKAIRKCVNEQGLTQNQISEALNISQPRVSNLLSKDNDTFSIDSLVNFLGRLGISVKLLIDNNEKDIEFK